MIRLMSYLRISSHVTNIPLQRKLNTNPNTIEDKEVLKKLLMTPPVRKVDLHFPLGLEVTARNLKGVTIKDALEAIYKQFKKKVRDRPLFDSSSFPPIFHWYSLTHTQQDDELEAPYLAGFEWDPEECYTRFIVHQKKTGEVSNIGSSKKKNKKKDAGEE